MKLFNGCEDYMPVLLRRGGYRIKEIEVEEHPRVSGRSKYSVLGRGLRGIFTLFAVKCMKLDQLNYEISTE